MLEAIFCLEFLKCGLILFAAIIVITLGLWYYTWYYYTKDLKGINGPKPLPILGSGLLFMGDDSTMYLTKPIELIKTYGDAVKVMLGFSFNILLIDYKLMEFFLGSIKYIDKSELYTYMHKWLGTGLLTSTGEKWRKRRKIITPTYHFKILEQFTDVFDANAGILAGKLEKEVDKGSTDVYPFVTLCALDNICESVMGTSVNAQMVENSEYVLSVKEMCRIVAERAFSVFQKSHFFYKFSRNYRIETKALKVLHAYTNSVIASRRKALENESFEDDGEKKRVAFLDLLLKSTIDGKPLSDEDIREEVDTFMFEGHDTTASAMTFALYCLANNPGVQEKVVREQREIFGDDPDRVCAYRDLQDMKYLELVIKETLRMFPSVPFIARELTEDCKYADDVIFKKGTQLTFFIYCLMHDERFYPNPEEFIPERFEELNNSKFPYTYVPFSAGPRNCIGQKFAMLEMKSVISKVVRKFELRPVVPEHKLQLVPETILKSSNGVLVSVKRRCW